MITMRASWWPPGSWQTSLRKYAKETDAYKKAANWVIVELTAALNKANLKLRDNPCKASSLAQMINMVEKGEISGKQAKVVFEEIMKGKDPRKVVEEKGMKQMSDEGALLAMITPGAGCQSAVHRGL